MRIALWGAAGAIGRSFATVLRERGEPFVVVGRSREKLEAVYAGVPGVEIRPADVATADGARRAAEGIDLVLYSLGVPYTKKAFSEYPRMMELAMDATAAAGTGKVIHISNVYPYGVPRTRPVVETHPLEPSSVKGRYRKEQEDVILGAHEATGRRTLVLRLPDFYGPGAALSFTQTVFDAALAGKTADLLGPADTPHEFVYVPDVGPVIRALADRDDAFGRAYNLAGAGTITMRDFATRVFRAVGRQPSLRVAGPGMQRVLGLFIPVLRELREMQYLLETPVILDDSRLQEVLGGIRRTPYDEGIRRTVEHLRGA
jgi:nucleoside-diphosphate-sugar epimerase